MLKLNDKKFNSNPSLKQIKSLEGITITKNYCCPNCGEGPPDFEGAYYKGSNDLYYPSILNYSEFFNGDLNIVVWDEVHQCDECRTIYYFSNGN